MFITADDAMSLVRKSLMLRHYKEQWQKWHFAICHMCPPPAPSPPVIGRLCDQGVSALGGSKKNHSMESRWWWWRRQMTLLKLEV